MAKGTVALFNIPGPNVWLQRTHGETVKTLRLPAKKKEPKEEESQIRKPVIPRKMLSRTEMVESSE